MNIGINPHPFYNPLWRRIAIVACVAVWFGLEIFSWHDGMWTTIAGATLVYCIWQFLFAYPQVEKK